MDTNFETPKCSKETIVQIKTPPFQSTASNMVDHFGEVLRASHHFQKIDKDSIRMIRKIPYIINTYIYIYHIHIFVHVFELVRHDSDRFGQGVLCKRFTANVLVSRCPRPFLHRRSTDKVCSTSSPLQTFRCNSAQAIFYAENPCVQ